jgi:hypothetical protein
MKIAVFSFLMLIASTYAHSWGIGSCIVPMHYRRKMIVAQPEVKLSILDQKLIINSSRSFRGFLVYGEKGLTFMNEPKHSKLSDMCNGVQNGSLSHTSPYERSEMVLDFECMPGSSVSAKMYLVYRYSEPYVTAVIEFTCPGQIPEGADSLTVPMPHL